MNKYDVYGLKQFSNELRMQLEDAYMQELAKGNNIGVQMLAVDNLNDAMMDHYNQKYGIHSHYLLIDLAAKNLLMKYKIIIHNGFLGSEEIGAHEIKNYVVVYKHP
jgi:hypothetical protein